MRRALTLGTAGTITFLLAAAMPYADAAAGRTSGSDISVIGDGAQSSTPSEARPAPPRAGVAVTFGRTNPNNGAGANCGPTIQVIVQDSATAPTTYTAPTAGVITSYSHNARATFVGHLRLLAFTPQGAGAYAQVGKSELNLLTPGVMNTFPARVPVPAGAVLGLQADNENLLCADNAPGQGVIRVGSVASYDPNAPAGNFTGVATSNYYINLSAVLEPDADGDGYGDLSQDLCLESAKAHDACPAPDTTLTKAPKKKSTKRKATITFSSTVAGSTFTCAVDKKAAVPCTSPFKKKYKLGKHTVVITATSPAGIVDPTPVTVTFKVKKPS